jgi:GDPmannose 4,6-dehydratase
MKAVIFGIKGQDGQYLRSLLLEKGCEVIGVSRSPGNWVRGDVGNFDTVEKIIKYNQPDYIFHFAADSTTKHEALFTNHKAIETGTLNILENVNRHSRKSKVFLSGSALQFKNTGNPINEQTPFAANSPYAVSRIQSVYAGRYYREVLGLNVYVGYFFNHDSPLRTERHINQKTASAAKRIASGSSEKLEIGNIDVKKEFNFAGDIMQAVLILVNQDQIFEAVIGSGQAYSIKDWVEYCFQHVNKDWHEYVIIKNNFIPGYDTLVSDPNLIKSLGWKPVLGIKELADIMMKNE